MALAIHESFPFRGKQLKRGDVVFGADADELARSHHAHRCSPIADERVAHLRPSTPSAPAVASAPVVEATLEDAPSKK